MGEGRSVEQFRLKLNFGSVLSRQELDVSGCQLVQAIVGERIHVKDLAAMLAAQKDFTIAFGQYRVRIQT